MSHSKDACRNIGMTSDGTLPPGSRSSVSITPKKVTRLLESSAFRCRYNHLSDRDAAKVNRYGSPLGSVIECHAKIPRCMERLKEMIGEAESGSSVLASGTVVLADELGDGCGRFDRVWHAPRGGVWLAVAWADTLLPEYSRLPPLAAGSACCETVRSYGIDAAVKWVNDIHVQGRKVGGVLCETYTAKSGDRYHLIGIGMNTNVDGFPQELKQTAVSMHEIIGHSIDSDQFTLNLIASLAWNFGLIHLQEEYDLEHGIGDPAGADKRNYVIDAWLRLSDTVGRKVLYGYDVVRQPLYRARVLGIDHMGGLKMQLEDGGIVTEYSGEIKYLD